MRLAFLVFLVAGALLGCSEKNASTAPVPEAEPAASAANPRRVMAYEHAVSLDVEAARVAAIHAATEAACRALVEEQCVVLESRLDTGDYTSATLKLRARPGGVRRLLTELATQGDVIHQSVKAEDLAAPIQDATRKLAMLEDYRSRLEALRVEAGGDVDALIKVNRELASVQGEIEALSGQQAHLLQRVETEILTVSLSSFASRSFWQPVSSALSSFGGDLAEGVATAITGTAYLVPWGIVLVVLVWIGRKLLRRRTLPKKAA